MMNVYDEHAWRFEPVTLSPEDIQVRPSCHKATGPSAKSGNGPVVLWLEGVFAGR